MSWLNPMYVREGLRTARYDLTESMLHVLTYSVRNAHRPSVQDVKAFAYAHVSTSEQTTGDPIREIAMANIDRKRIAAEKVSGSGAAVQRAGFTKLIDGTEEGDVLAVAKLDLLGRNAMDVRSTVEKLTESGFGEAVEGLLRSWSDRVCVVLAIDTVGRVL